MPTYFDQLTDEQKSAYAQLGIAINRILGVGIDLPVEARYKCLLEVIIIRTNPEFLAKALAMDDMTEAQTAVNETVDRAYNELPKLL